MLNSLLQKLKRIYQPKSEKSFAQEVKPTMVEPVLGRGYIDYLDYSNGYLSIAGWMFLEETPFDRFLVKVNNILYERVDIVERVDVEKAFSFISTARMSGFEFRFPIPEGIVRDWADISILGIQQNMEMAKINTIYRLDFQRSLPDPPSELMQRVANVSEPMGYWCRALNSFGEFLKAIQKHRELSSIDFFLDWGCGCGRLTGLFLKHTNIPNIYGCDIDKEAVEWCNQQLRSGYFSVINPYPPTHFTDSMFDMIISYSVFTHLTREVQIQWIKEMKRILKPGGLFFASVHGDFAASFAPRHVREEIAHDGISDSSFDPNLEGIAPSGYYKGVYQGKEYTFEKWSNYFKIVDYIERGMGNFQDLVIMKKE